jgi:uncharacterized OsmC-like protein
MQIAVRVSNTSGHEVEGERDHRKQSVVMPPKNTGRGSSVNGGELLFVALATRFCNDIYREAAKRGIDVEGVKVEMTGAFGNLGEPAHDTSNRADVHSNASQAAIDDLIRATDSAAEIHNTLRADCEVRLTQG